MLDVSVANPTSTLYMNTPPMAETNLQSPPRHGMMLYCFTEFDLWRSHPVYIVQCVGNCPDFRWILSSLLNFGTILATIWKLMECIYAHKTHWLHRQEPDLKITGKLLLSPSILIPLQFFPWLLVWNLLDTWNGSYCSHGNSFPWKAFIWGAFGYVCVAFLFLCVLHFVCIWLLSV